MTAEQAADTVAVSKKGGLKVLCAPPDGYAIVIVSATHTVNPSLRRGMPFDAIADFAPITLATTQGSAQLLRTLEPEMVSGAIDADRSRQISSTGNRVYR